MNGAAMEHDDAVAAARDHLAAAGTRPLGPLPAGFAAFRAAMHGIAEDVLKPRRVLETGNEIALRFTSGGFGTPPWPVGAASGRSGQIRVEGLELVAVDGDDESRSPLPGLDPAIAADADSAAALADWFAFATVVLAELLSRHPGLEPAPIRLWPEHFDVATELGSEPARQRANYGGSPGDDDHPDPYLYVGPWDQSVSGAPWNATGFTGAELGYADLLAADDQLAAAIDFCSSRLEALAGR